MTDAERQRLTYRNEKWRAASQGVLETAGTTFALLIAVRHFDAGPTAKALVVAGVACGLLLSPLFTSWVGATGWRVSRAAAGLGFVGALGWVLAAVSPWLPGYIAGALIGSVCTTAGVPLITQMYQNNYPREQRGRLFARTVMIRIATAALFAWLAGSALTADFSRYRWVLVIFAAALALGSWRLWGTPSAPLERPERRHPLQSLRFAGTDPVFRRALISWMLMGFGNLMMLPMRVEYLANPRYGLALAAGTIALLTAVLPNIARLLVNPIWGALFDRMNFFLLRILINLFFIVSILSFFTGGTLTGLIIGAILFGLANAGGELAWSLWVTKIAPPERVAEYMSAHTFLTGVRGLAAPFVAFYVAQRMPLSVLGAISGGLILLACVVLLPEVRWRARRDAVPLAPAP